MNTNTAKVVTKLTYYETKKTSDASVMRTRIVLWCGDSILDLMDFDQSTEQLPYKRFKRMYDLAAAHNSSMESEKVMTLEVGTLAKSTPESQAFIHNTALQISKGVSRSKTLRIEQVLLIVDWRR